MRLLPRTYGGGLLVYSCFFSVSYLVTMRLSPFLPVPSHLCCNPDDVHSLDLRIFLYIVYPCFWLPTSTPVFPLMLQCALRHFS